MSNKLALLNHQPPNVEQQNFRKYVVVLITCITGIVAHLGFAALFFSLGIDIIGIFDLSVTVLWGWAAFINYRGHHSKAVFLILALVLIDITFVTGYLGLGSGFQFYLWPVACLAVINPGPRKVRAALFGFGIIILFASLKYFFGDVPSHPQLFEYVDTLYMLNAVLAGIPLVLAVLSAREIHESQEKTFTELATIDELTGLYNRRYVNDFLDKYYDDDPADQPCCVVLADIDFFKKINDNYGHDVGDEILCEISLRLKNAFRDSDIICRWGGEEFMILLNKTKVRKAYHIVDRIRQEISRTVETKESGPLKVTMSFGIADTTECEDYEQLIKLADEHLYRAKNNGRNCVVISSLAEEEERLVSIA